MLALKAENISKQYRLGQVGTGTLSHDLNRFWAQVRGKEDPYLKIGEANDRAVKGESEYVWSLKDINFEIEQGDAVGIIGRNGAGKSTLLKLLSKVTKPTTGKIYTKGRIASLLEVGTGFHPEMTGRENIFLNGAILGMTRKEITRKFDEIVDFSGVERYIDTPVKRYSSGMYVRLAFAVAAHLESEILIVDEVLAVGDAEFQKKCLGKMGDVSRGEGRTVLFVSHNLGAVSNLCTQCLVLTEGSISYHGTTANAIVNYLNEGQSDSSNSELYSFIESFHDETIQLKDLTVQQNSNDSITEFTANDNIEVKISYQIKHDVVGFRLGFDLIEKNSDITVFRTYHDDDAKSIEVLRKGIYQSVFQIPSHLIKPGSYTLSLVCGIHNHRWILFHEANYYFNVINMAEVNKIYSDERPGVIMPFIECNTFKIK